MGDYELLSKIKSPADVKRLDEKDLAKLCSEIREKLIETVSLNGGHLSPNLGVVELTVALHRTFNLPKDSIVWDVGHQSYTHKLLTGRFDDFYTLRQKGGISGFPKRSESKYDDFNTGHSSTSISAAYGIARAKMLSGDQSHTVAVIGDGSFTGGLAFEAMNNAGRFKKNFIVILNDNKMSISKNVGAFPRYLTTVRIQPWYIRVKKNTEKVLSKIPLFGRPISAFLRRSKSKIKNLVYKNTLFDCFGFTYIGPIDGHDIPELENALSAAKKFNSPVLLHVVTKKGKGYLPAEENPGAFHGIGKFDIDSGEPISSHKGFSAEFGNALCDLAEKDKKICAITAAMAKGTGLEKFSIYHKERFFDVGIAEEHAVTFACGLASKGMRPVFAVYSTFLQRAYDQILHDVCIQHLPVVFAIDRAGLVGSDGETHQGIFDLSFLTSIPNMTVMAPKNGSELSEMLEFALLNFNSPIAIRYPRGQAYDGLEEHNAPIRYGKAEMIIEESDIALVAAGNMLITALAVRDKLKEKGYNITVVNERFIKPVDTDMLDRLSESHRLIVTMEENVLSGGFGEAVCQYYDDTCNDIDVLNIALPDDYVEHGNVDILRRESGVDRDSIIAKVLNRWANVLNKDKRNE